VEPKDEGDEMTDDQEIDLTAKSHDADNRYAKDAPLLNGAGGQKPSDQGFVVDWQVAGPAAR
jgi:hypothetical protein